MDADAPGVSNRIGDWLDRPMPRRVVPLMIALLVLCVLATHGIIRYGSITAALSRAGGKQILIDPQFKSFGTVPAGEMVVASFITRNEAAARITIQGAKESCGCAVVGDLPCAIEPGASRSIGLSVIAPKDSGSFAGTVSLYTDDRDTPVLALGYEGRVVKSVVAGPGSGVLNRARSPRRPMR